MKAALTGILLTICAHLLQAQNIPIGTWRTHYTYSDITLVAPGEKGAFAGGQNGLFFYDAEDGSLRKYSKIDGLSGGRYSALAYDAARNVLIIGYENGLIDLVNMDGGVTTISSLVNAQLITSPSINHILVSESKYYLSTNIGVLVVDAEAQIISETYRNLGQDGQLQEIYSSAILADTLFLAAGEELLLAPIQGVNLLDFNSYQRFDWPGAGLLQYVGSTDFNLFAASAASLSLYSSGTFTFNDIPELPIRSLTAGEDSLLVTAGSGLYFISNTAAPQLITTLTEPADAGISADGVIYVADREQGLVSGAGTFGEAFRPNGLLHTVATRLYSRDDKVFALYGETILQDEASEGFSLFENGIWSNFGQDVAAANPIPLPGSFSDVTYRPADRQYYLAAPGEGLLLIDNAGELSVIDENTPGGPFTGEVPQLSSLATTLTGDLLLSAYGLTQPLFVLDTENTWSKPGLTSGFRERISSVETAFSGEYFTIAQPPSGQGGILAYDPESGEERVLTRQNNELPGSIIFDIAEDLDGRLWIGGNAGVAFFPFPAAVFDENILAQRPVYEQRFLLENEAITSIEIDGGNRKWLGSYSGAWLFDDSEEEIIEVYHFTSDNSPLPTDTIYDISINSITGEVFFATSGGVVSYREAATSGENVFGTVKVFPNPVPSDFSGVVGISGLVNSASVKITNIRGKLIRQLEARGGTAAWNLRDENGRRAGPGVYLLFSGNADGTESYAGKIAILP